MQSDRRFSWWSWADIIGRANQLGIPNFQRGAVWVMGNRTALLESMYEASPCGSFVLWQPDDGGDPRRHGVPVLWFGEDVAEPIWLVDGQQRTRAMLDTYLQLLTAPRVASWSLVREEDMASLRSARFNGLKGFPGALADFVGREEENEVETGDDSDRRFWGVVLPAIRQFDQGGGGYFGHKGESRGVRRGSVFRRHSPSVRVQRDSQGKHKSVPPRVLGLVPLATLVAPTGIFYDDKGRQLATDALASFSTDSPNFAQLDNVLPWGSQFVTGHVYERIEDGEPIPMSWADIHRHATDANVAFWVSRLSGLFAPKWLPVFQQFRDMFAEGRFAVGWLPQSDVSAAIDAYVRINRAGIRVRQEEQALALLSRACPQLLDELAAFIKLRDGRVSAQDGRSLLVHESDRQMGFAVWMRAVTRYSALALLGTTACHWLGSSAIEKDTFGERLGRVGDSKEHAGRKTWARQDYSDPRELVQECSGRATRALALMDSLLCQELLLDHRMARPSTWALTPLAELLYRVPDSAFEELDRDTDVRAALARLLHWTLLAPYLDQTDLRRLISDIHGVPSGYVEQPIAPWSPQNAEWRNALREAVSRYQATLLDLWCRKDSASTEGPHGQLTSVTRSQALTDLAVRAFQIHIRDARSLQHPAVGWLYAIERRGRAREFLWQAQYDGHRDRGDRIGIPKSTEPHRLEEELRRPDTEDPPRLYPEKQHIVPFDYARRIAGKGGTRATASPANAIGNLTWLSQRQNGLDGFSNRWAVMDATLDRDNLAARGMLAQSPSGEDPPTALSLYESIRDAVLDGRIADAERPFEEFCEARGLWMVQEMRTWLEQPLSDTAKWWLGN